MDQFNQVFQSRCHCKLKQCQCFFDSAPQKQKLTIEEILTKYNRPYAAQLLKYANIVGLTPAEKQRVRAEVVFEQATLLVVILVQLSAGSKLYETEKTSL